MPMEMFQESRRVYMGWDWLGRTPTLPILCRCQSRAWGN